MKLFEDLIPPFKIRRYNEYERVLHLTDANGVKFTFEGDKKEWLAALSDPFGRPMKK